MCGIVGMLALSDVVQRTLQGLELLEYRGYDSYGLVTVNSARLTLTKDVGSISRAVKGGKFGDVGAANLALAHTRWATHGGVSQHNAHPHISYDNKIAIVHNGVIENHGQLRRGLEEAGVSFCSETDSEVIAHLIAKEWEVADDILEAFCAATSRLAGEYAIAMVCTDDPAGVYGAKFKSPLLFARNGAEVMLASDQAATAELSSEVTFLEDGDVIRLTPSKEQIRFLNESGSWRPVNRESVKNSGAKRSAGKAGYEHYMLKEINEVPAAIRVALSMPESELQHIIPSSEKAHLTLVGSGSAYYVAAISQYLLTRLAGVAAHAYPSDEAEYLAQFLPEDVLVAISQSGETFDTLEVVRDAAKQGVRVCSLTNVPSSTLERIAEHPIQQGCGPEVCVLSTKSIVSQVVILARVALLHGLKSGHLVEPDYKRLEQSLTELPSTIQLMLDKTSSVIQSVARRFSRASHWFFIGRGSLYPVALESALKFKEVSYHHAEGIAAGFFKHGTISLIDEDFYTVALLPSKTNDRARFNATLSNVSEIVARRGQVIGLGPGGLDQDEITFFKDYIELPYHNDDLCDIVVQLVAGQLMAYYCALDLGREIDQPRALAKSVTVR